MMKTHTHTLAIALVIGAVITLLLGCGPAGEPDTARPLDDSNGGTDQRQEAATGDGVDERQLEIDDGVVVIGMYMSGGRSYNDPVGLHVEPGTTVRFVNHSGMHSATAYHPENGYALRIPEGAEAWDSGLIGGRGQSFEVTLDVEGVYDYLCIPHVAVGHVGRIIVGDPEAALPPSADDLPAAARNALPAVETIMADHVVWQ
jgi:plastocyanin